MCLDANILVELQQVEESMYSSTKLLQRSDIYLVKKSKQPDHLLSLLIKQRPPEEDPSSEEEQKERIRKKMLQKRIDTIMKTTSCKPTVSDPLPYIKKKWVSPLQQRNSNDVSPPSKELQTRIELRTEDGECVKQVVKVLDLNKRLKYFGEYLQVQFNPQGEKVQVAHITENQSRMGYLTRKFQQLQRVMKPKLCIFNYPLHDKLTFVNYLQNDQFFNNIMRKEDSELVRILIDTLMACGSFTLTSFMQFYNIFVWQCADKREQIDFVARLLMKDAPQRPLADISKVIDTVCHKIHLQNFNKSLQNFNEVMKKLIFGDDYVYSSRRQYYLTRKALVESLQVNEECISIFINIFYSC